MSTPETPALACAAEQATIESVRQWARERVSEGAIPEPNTGCWLWTRSTGERGYARSSYRGRPRRIARALLGLPEMTRGTATGPFLMACHVCDTPQCVNEAHLFIGTMRENALDALNKGRLRYGTLGRDPHCIHGHPLTGDNARMQCGKRVCRTCRAAKDRRRRARLRAAQRKEARS